MSQTYTDNCFATGHAVQTDMQNIEDNFAALKSSFSGNADPADLIAGMWWLDTNNDILKIRNEANNAWLSVWDFANNKPVITNLSNEITNAMCAAALKDPIAATAGLRTLGTTAQKAAAGNDSRFETVSDGYVTNAKLSGLVAGDAPVAQADAEKTKTNQPAYSKIKEIQIGQAGTYRIKFDLKSGGAYTAYGRVYKNGVAVGSIQTNGTSNYVTKSQDIAGWSIGDLCQLYYATYNAAVADVYVKNFRIFCDYSRNGIVLLN